MKEFTVHVDPETGRVDLRCGKTTYTWGSVEILRTWLSLNSKLCDAELCSVVAAVLNHDPELKNTKACYQVGPGSVEVRDA